MHLSHRLKYLRHRVYKLYLSKLTAQTDALITGSFGTSIACMNAMTSASVGVLKCKINGRTP